MITLVFALSLASVLQTPSPASSNLRIVVLEGEDAINIVQQKTAVRPLVEVRDRNNVPVAGATVTFTIGGGQPAAFAGGVQAVTVTTNAAGQAAASGFSALGPGAVQIQVQAAFQGQVAAAAISQTNFATAAAAAQAGGAAASGGAGGATTGAAGGAGGGGLSATTIGIIGAVAAGGAVAATQIGGGGGGDEGGATVSYTTQFSGQMTTTMVTLNSGTCVSTRAVSGTLTLGFPEDGNNNAVFSISATEVSAAGGLACPAGGLNPAFGDNVPVTGSQANPSFSSTRDGASPGAMRLTQTFSFSGTQSGEVINGTATYTETFGGNAPGRPENVISGGGTISLSLTLRR